jgi:hypothetical protein
VSHSFQARCDVLKHLFGLLFSLFLSHVFECRLLRVHDSSLVQRITIHVCQLVIFVHKSPLCGVSNLVQVVQHRVVQSFKTRLVKIGLYTSGKEYLLAD